MNEKSIIPTPDLARKLISQQFPEYEVQKQIIDEVMNG